MRSLTAYGHSWVQGDGASRPRRRFVALAAQQLNCLLEDVGVGGTSSSDTADLVRREPPRSAQLYLVMTGLNDARLHGASSTALEAFGASLTTILRAFHAANPTAFTVALEQPHLIDYSGYAPHNRGSDEAVDAYNQHLHATASRHPRVVVAAVTAWSPTTMLTADSVHPNDAGHAQLALAVVQAASAITRRER